MNWSSGIHPISFALLMSLVALIGLSTHGEAADVAIDIESTSWEPQNVTTDDEVTISVDIIFIDSEPAEDGVTLKYALCTAEQCYLDKTAVMTRVGESNTWEATIGPFSPNDPNGEPYEDIKYHFEVEGVATDGDEDPEASSDTKYIYFEEVPDDDNNGDDEPSDNGNSEEDSPLGIFWLIPLIAAALVIYLGRKRR